MYVSAKKILSRIVSPKQLMKHEVFLRNIYSLLYSGSKHQCSVCNKKLSRFLQLPNNDLLCARCGSLSRDRRLWTLLNSGFLYNGITVLDFSPSRALARKMKSIGNINYISTDLSGNFIADFQYDITSLDIKDNTVDLIICYHILEHIPDDAKAMAELYRVLKPNGKAIIQTPFKDGDIYEDFSITSPAEREIHFGQDDHVRIYSVQGLKGRLEQAGFVADARIFEGDEYHGLTANETVFVLTKP
ncbi:methyltransferase domain-containing protein [Flavobacterium sp. Sd200]|uniref:class I SAM-dependent methyltransferase n=1 Tax=Flavobacterium sp. Sd200 TaxID=2692211 RepID=UPI001369752C|nr:class I SAM-dependent methyltransferase [Flavobacterium sp. Sd200]MXN92402.1 methyltransferase domain-containing protein [Flavobacterium sp. Sd200]